MKKTLIGCCLILAGAMGVSAFSICAALTPRSGWTTPPGRFWTAIMEGDLVFPFSISLLFIILGLILLVIEFITGFIKKQ